MNVETSYSGSTAVAVVDGRIDSANAKDFDEELSAIIDRGGKQPRGRLRWPQLHQQCRIACSPDRDQEDERSRRRSGALLRAGSHPRSPRGQRIRSPHEGLRNGRRGAGQLFQVARRFQGSPPPLPGGTTGAGSSLEPIHPGGSACSVIPPVSPAN